MAPSITIRPLRPADTTAIPQAFSHLGWPGKTAELYERYLADQTAGHRLVFVADRLPASAADQTVGNRPVVVADCLPADAAEQGGLAASDIAGYVTVVWTSDYGPFAEARIPEVQDLNVLPHFRRQGIASALMNTAEAAIAARSAVAGIGVGLYADYGPAHLMYLRRGYLPDGRGVTYQGATIAPCTSVPVDDDLCLMMLKRLDSAVPPCAPDCGHSLHPDGIAGIPACG